MLYGWFITPNLLAVRFLIVPPCGLTYHLSPGLPVSSVSRFTTNMGLLVVVHHPLWDELPVLNCHGLTPCSCRFYFHTNWYLLRYVSPSCIGSMGFRVYAICCTTYQLKLTAARLKKGTAR